MALDFFAGCLGGCAGVAVGHPFDTVKVRLQTQDFRNPKYTGTWHCITDTVKKESVRGLYKGMSSPMAGVAAVNAIVFGVHGNICRHLKDPDSLRSQVFAGSMAGLTQAFVSSPMELLKTRVQLQTEACSSMSNGSLTTAASSSSTVSASSKYNSPLDCMRKIYTTEGWKGLFRGQLITLTRDVPAFATYFFTYEYMTRTCSRSDGSVSPLVVLTAGGLAGIASWVLTYPIDVVKSRLQADGIGGVNKYKGIIDCARMSIASEGWAVMSRGLTSTVIRAFPTNAATFAVVTWTMQLLGQKEEHDESSTSAWREVMGRGEQLVNAAKVPTLQHNDLAPYNNFNTTVSFLPQVLAASSTEEHIHETEEGQHIHESEEGHTEKTKCSEPLLCAGDHFLFCRRYRLTPLVRNQHNLSNTL